MALVDIHAHLDDKQFAKDLDAVIERAKNIGLKVIINNGINPGSNRKTLELAKKFDIVKPALGLYPLEGLKLKEEEIEKEIEFILENKDQILAVGEIGLDAYWKKETLEKQKPIFQEFIDLAEKIKKPVIVHSRNAEKECLEMLESSKLKVVMHCFSGSLSLAKKIEDKGWSFSIPPSIVRSKHFQELVEKININQLLTESDAPYLGVKHGQRNEPAFVRETVKKIAELKALDEIEVENNLYMNFQGLF